jgi:hypothetical protein
MSEQTFPDELPASYRAQYGGQWLHDREGSPLPEATQARVRSRVEETVATVKAKHGL